MTSIIHTTIHFVAGFLGAVGGIVAVAAVVDAIERRTRKKALEDTKAFLEQLSKDLEQGKDPEQPA